MYPVPAQLTLANFLRAVHGRNSAASPLPSQPFGVSRDHIAQIVAGRARCPGCGLTARHPNGDHPV